MQTLCDFSLGFTGYGNWAGQKPQQAGPHVIESIGKLVCTEKQRNDLQIEHNNKDLTLAVHIRDRDDLPRVLATYPMTISENSANSKYPKGYTECKSLNKQ